MMYIVEQKKRRGRARITRPTFTTIDRLSLRGVGTIVFVTLDKDTNDFAHLVGKKIVIDGRMEICFSIERLDHSAPWKAGERIGLLIRKAK